MFAVRHGVPAGLDLYCGLLLLVGLWAAHCLWRAQKSDPILTIAMNVDAGDHSSFLTISAPYLSSSPQELGYLLSVSLL